MEWRKEGNSYYADYGTWHFKLDTSDTINMLWNKRPGEKDYNNLLCAKEDVRKCFHAAFDLVLMYMRREDESII